MSAFLDDMDETTLQLVVQLKGKAKETDRSDADVAFDTYQAELVSFPAFAADRALSRRIARQEGTYPRVTTITAPAEQQAVPDASNPITSQPAESSRAEEIVADEIVTEEILAADAVHTVCNTDIFDNDSIVDMPESSSWGASRKASKRTRSRGPDQLETRSCISCTKDYDPSNFYLASCDHLYCATCLQKLFHLSLVDESLFPPRCCRKPIPTDQVQHIIPKQLMQEFVAKEIEFSTVNRTYCHQSQCSAFIPPTSIEGDIATCPACQAKTCVLCKRMEHDRNDVCQEDTATQEVLKLAAEKKWPRCNKCRAIVELNVGCYHMTCRCGGQFCYLCEAPWKTCACRQWDEPRLFAGAEQRVNRAPNARNMTPQQRAAALTRARRNAIRNHACEHDGRWTKIYGEHTCEGCNDRLSEFIFRCDDDATTVFCRPVRDAGSTDSPE
ncbi:putative E3 ubiquitin-protein ligase rbrA [Colletotrichum fructicola Nara gc5]|uniref:RBR-type E3 ubiquitin transferase n=1 Tax=Colletotrichum fructicola (strain Nara gc5) TaxID=1213859 RepID=A0A7J6JDK8_COLFN|nr:putative E3 ubiquitin-protein ligase rbrA [Colletotrichum fructicola Nara gc5]